MINSLVVTIGNSSVGMRTSTGAEARGSSVPPHLPGREDGIDHLISAVETTRAQLDPGFSPDLVVVGTALMPTDVEEFGRALQGLWPRATLAVCTDGVLAHAAALGGFGVVAHVGSGVVVMGLDESGTLHRVDGWGAVLGDRGGGFELGRAGLRAVFEARDDVGPATQLTELAAEWLGDLEREASTRLMADPRRVETVAGFAEYVSLAADSDDPVAAQLVTECAIRVAQSCAAAARKVNQTMVAVRGGVTQSRAFMTALGLALERFELEIEKARYDTLCLPAEIMLTDPYQKHLVYLTPPVHAET